MQYTIAGEKIHCPTCNQRLEVPHPADRNKTQLAPLVTIQELGHPHDTAHPIQKNNNDDLAFRWNEVAFRVTVTIGFGLSYYFGGAFLAFGTSSWQRSLARLIIEHEYIYQSACLGLTAISSLLVFQLWKSRYVKAKIVTCVLTIFTGIIILGLAIAKDVISETVQKWLGW